MSQAVDTLEPTSERRAFLRVPVDRTVKVGPAGAPTRATMSAVDLSRGGVFIEAPATVRVGTRFSAELELSSGEQVYIPEAEVAHVRDGPVKGFGIRFINLPAEVARVLEEEMARLDAEPPPTQTPTLVLAEDEDPAPGPAASAWIEPMTGLPEPLDTEIDERPPMRMPSHWMIMLGLGCVLLVAAAVFVVLAELGEEPPSVESVPLGQAGLPSETHDVLMEKAEAPAMDPAPEEDVDLAPLPLVPERTPELARRPEAAEDPAPKPKAKTEARPEPAAPIEGGPRIVEFELPTAARVKTSYALRSPPRFVVDLIGVDRAPEPRSDDPLVRRVRFGRHPGFSRIVLDLNQVLKSGEAKLRGGRLSLRLVPRVP